MSRAGSAAQQNDHSVRHPPTHPWPRAARRSADLACRPPTSPVTRRDSDSEPDEVPDRRIRAINLVGGACSFRMQIVLAACALCRRRFGAWPAGRPLASSRHRGHRGDRAERGRDAGAWPGRAPARRAARVRRDGGGRHAEPALRGPGGCCLARPGCRCRVRLVVAGRMRRSGGRRRRHQPGPRRPAGSARTAATRAGPGRGPERGPGRRLGMSNCEIRGGFRACLDCPHDGGTGRARVLVLCCGAFGGDGEIPAGHLPAELQGPAGLDWRCGGPAGSRSALGVGDAAPVAAAGLLAGSAAAALR